MAPENLLAEAVFTDGYDAVPLHVAQAWAVLHGRDTDFPLAACGYRYEVPLGELPAADAAALSDWFARVKDFWRAGGPSRAPHVSTRRVAASYRENVNPGHKQDLGALFDALDQIPALGPVLHDATGAEPDWETLDDTVAACGGQLTRDGATATLIWPLPAAVAVPAPLGGLPMLGQTKRTLTLGLNHAGWRNRRARRLTRADVTVDDAWPAPQNRPRIALP